MFRRDDDVLDDSGLPVRRRRRLFRQRKIPIRYLVPNFFTLLSLCAGVTAIRMAIESRYEFAIGLIVAAALEAGCKRLLSEDLQHGQRIEGLRIENPFGL